MFCPAAWKQRAHDGVAAATGYDPPSALLSPANPEAMAYLGADRGELVGLSVEVGLQPHLQVGEPWWWVRRDGAICCYDDAAKAALGGNPVAIDDVRGEIDRGAEGVARPGGRAVGRLNRRHFRGGQGCCAKRPRPTCWPICRARSIRLRPRSGGPICRSAGPSPTFDVLQLEDYEWVTGGRRSFRAGGLCRWSSSGSVTRPDDQHYFSGFVAGVAQREQWRAILDAAREAQASRRREEFHLGDAAMVARRRDPVRRGG